MPIGVYWHLIVILICAMDTYVKHLFICFFGELSVGVFGPILVGLLFFYFLFLRFQSSLCVLSGVFTL